MRIRSTKPEFWRSERIASVSWDARLVLKGLESYVDDNGVGKDDLALIVGDVFPRDLIREPSRTLARVSEAISALTEAGLVHRYEHEGTQLLYLAFWEVVQRIDKPSRGRFPRPDGTLNFGESIIRESVANPREPSRALAPGTGEQGNRGTEEQRNSKGTLTPRGVRIPSDFSVTPEMRQWASENVPLVNVDRCLPEFVDYWKAVAGDRGRKTDWVATWRNGMRKQQTFAERDAAARGPGQARVYSVEEIERRRREVESRVS